MQAFATELVSLKPDALVADGTAQAVALRQATRTIPIVFVMASDPVGVGIVESLARPSSDFVAAVKGSGVIPIKLNVKAQLNPEWKDLFSHLASRKAHLGLSRLARYASAQGIAPEGINDEVINGFMAAVREGSLHRKPNELHRQGR
jgi:ABC-type uncharacterized transport system substrate-binding protein